MTPEERYTATADRLVQRMLESFKEHPEAAKLDSVWDMLKVPGFQCDDIGPSHAQAGWAFNTAKRLFRSTETPEPKFSRNK